jgi:hypothetical protein
MLSVKPKYIYDKNDLNRSWLYTFKYFRHTKLMNHILEFHAFF